MLSVLRAMYTVMLMSALVSYRYEKGQCRSCVCVMLHVIHDREHQGSFNLNPAGT